MSFSASASRTMPRDYEDEFTFQPKLNARSVAMEQARVDRGEVTGRDRGEYLHNKASSSALTQPEWSTATHSERSRLLRDDGNEQRAAAAALRPIHPCDECCCTLHMRAQLPANKTPKRRVDRLPVSKSWRSVD